MTLNNPGSSQTIGLNEYLNRGIKEIITERPEVEAILDDYNIGCGPCMVGTCLLKDIVEIHALSPSNEQEMMGRIAESIQPGHEAKASPVKHRLRDQKAVTYSPPMQMVVSRCRESPMITALQR